MGGRTLLTMQDFERLPDDGLRHELDEGELISTPLASDEHGDVGAEIVTLLRTYAKEHSLGRVCQANTGFLLSPDTVRAPDVTFVRRGRVPQRPGFFEGAPDLAVEVFSPSDSVPQLMRKVQQYLRAGSHTVWVVYPETKQVHVFEAAKEDRILNANDVLEAPELLPGFSVRVEALFE